MDRDYRFFYSKHFKKLEPNEKGECNVCCPFHDDKHASMQVNIYSGLYSCHAANCRKSGDEYRFYQTLNNMDFKMAKAEVDELFNDSTVFVLKLEEEDIDNWMERLQKTPAKLKFLHKVRGLTNETIKKYQIGWDTSRFSIPIRDSAGSLVNIRRYNPKGKKTSKVISFGTGYGRIRLYPVNNLGHKEILIAEGEMDCILANQMGYNAITTTGGAGNWSSSWNHLFKGKKVHICYDVDKGGKAGSERVAEQLHPVASEVKVINLPLEDPKGADITNYFVDGGRTKEDFDKLIKSADLFEPKEKELEEDNTVFSVHLSQASEEKFYNKKVRMNVIVAGKDLAPYLIPRVVKISCVADHDKCASCGVGVSGGEKTMTFGPTDSRILEMIGATNLNVIATIKRRAGMNKHCTMATIKIIEAQNIEEVTLYPEIDFSTDEQEYQEYVARRSFYIGHGLKMNRSYQIEALTTPDPKSQYATHLIYQVNESQDDIASFKMSKETYDRLLVFQADDIEKKFRDIHKDLAHNVTFIYERYDLLTAIDLVYHSVMSFEFQGVPVSKGLLECLVMGDTGTGKSESVLKIINHYRLGEFVTGENSSYAGLIGGVQQGATRWFITWGKIPLNDRRLVVIDEVSGLTVEGIAKMSGVRSSGVAEIVKIQTEKTNARARLIWISNPRSDRTLSTYQHGVLAIPELIGKPEDVRRFDFAITTASHEVSIKIINAATHTKIPRVYTVDNLCKDLVLWAWSRKRSQIKFSERATSAILAYATAMDKEYSVQIPLVEGSSQRITLARLAVATACRVFSTTDGQTVEVEKKHVDFAYQFLHNCYSKDSMEYTEFSDVEKEVERHIEENKKEIVNFLAEDKELLKMFSRCYEFQTDTISIGLNRSLDETKMIFGFLVKHRLIKQRKRYYYKTPEFIKLLKELRRASTRQSKF